MFFFKRTICLCFQTHSGVEYLLVTPSNSLYFPAVDFIRTNVGKAAVKQGLSHLPVIVDCRFILGADFTAAKVCFL
jgi:sodium-independent sulfate anion transporter 11